MTGWPSGGAGTFLLEKENGMTNDLNIQLNAEAVKHTTQRLPWFPRATLSLTV